MSKKNTTLTRNVIAGLGSALCLFAVTHYFGAAPIVKLIVVLGGIIGALLPMALEKGADYFLNSRQGKIDVIEEEIGELKGKLEELKEKLDSRIDNIEKDFIKTKTIIDVCFEPDDLWEERRKLSESVMDLRQETKEIKTDQAQITELVLKLAEKIKVETEID